MQQEQLQAEDDDEISLIDIFLFLKASGGNILKSTFVCLLAGGAYYFSVPKMYEASATIDMLTVAGKPVEAPAVLLEKMKLPLYFSTATLQACGEDDGFSSRAKFFYKINPSVNKSTPLVSFVARATSTQEAKACLNAVLADVSSKQDAIAIPLLDQKKQKLNELSKQLKVAEKIVNYLPPVLINNNITDSKLTASLLVIILRKTTVAEINDLQSQIDTLVTDLIEAKTRSNDLFNSVYSSEAPINKRPLFTLGLLLALGVFLGLLVTGVMRMAPRIWQKMRDAGIRAR